MRSVILLLHDMSSTDRRVSPSLMCPTLSMAEQALYKRVCEYMELDDRVEVLNNRLMVRRPRRAHPAVGVQVEQANAALKLHKTTNRPPGHGKLVLLLMCLAGDLQVLQEMLDMLRDHSNNAHSARLEWCAAGLSHYLL